MIAAEVVVRLGRAPRDGGRRDKGAGVGFVLVGENDVLADAGEAAVVARSGGEIGGDAGTLPLRDEALPMLGKGHGQGLHEVGDGSVVTLAESDADGELAMILAGDFTHDGDVAVEGLAELPVHLLVVAEILVAVALSDEAAG